MKKRNGRKGLAAVVETVSVKNQCDYVRANGKCGRAMCGNFGKPCPGRSCEEWLCEAEDDAASAEVQTGAVAVVAAPTDVMPPTGPAPLEGGPSAYRARVSAQYAAIETAKDNLLRECVKFGALLTEVGHYLGEARGRDRDGAGLRAWLESNCPDVNYSTAMGYKALAAKCVKMLGGGSQAVAVLQDKTEVVPPGEERPVAVEERFVARRDELFGEAKSRRELEQQYFKFMAAEGRGKPGRPRGTSGTPGRRAATAEERAADAEALTRETLGRVTSYLAGAWIETVAPETRDDFVRTLRDCADLAEERARRAAR